MATTGLSARGCHDECTMASDPKSATVGEGAIVVTPGDDSGEAEAETRRGCAALAEAAALGRLCGMSGARPAWHAAAALSASGVGMTGLERAKGTRLTAARP